MNTQTSALFNEAIDKIRDEMAAHAKDKAIEIVGEFLSTLLGMHPEYAEQILEGKKTIKGAMEAMRTEAAKHKNGSWACMDFISGIRCVLKYFNLPDMQDCQIMAVMNTAAAAPQPEVKPEPAKKPDELDIDALLAELEG